VVFIMAAVSWCLAAGQPAEPATEEVKEVGRGPEPDWVERIAWSGLHPTMPAGTPAELILSDSQGRLTANGGDYFFRTVVRLLNREGVQQNAEHTVTFAPEYQRVTWHQLRVLRGEEMLDLLPKVKFRRLQRELGLEGKVYDGRVTAMAVLDDIRVGDVIESAYTLHDTNPLMEGQQSFRMSLGAAYPVRHQSVIARLEPGLPRPAWFTLIPPDTLGLPEKIFRQAGVRLALRETGSEEEQVYRWEERDIPAIHFDQSISGEAAPYYPQIRWSSFGTWSKVVEWALPLFEQDEPMPAEFAQQIAEWKRLRDAEARLRAAVDWAQGEIRYFSMAFGQHNVKPRPLREVAATRFGDCKDKSVLLVRMLRALDIPAWPALVNTYSEHMVKSGGPDVYAFNHAIVAYEFDGQLRWVDPTIRQTAGRAGAWAVPPYSAALILREGELRPTALPDPWGTEPDTETVDRVTFDPESGAAEIATEVTIRGLQADFYRQAMEQIPAEQRSKNWFNYLARFYRRLEELQEPQIEDRKEENIIVVRARYRVEDLLRTEAGMRAANFYAYALRALIDVPDSRRRHWPLGLPFGRWVRHRIEADLPFGGPLTTRPHVVEAAGLKYRGEKSLVDRRFVANHDLRFTGRQVPPAQMAAYCDSVEEMFAELSSSVRAEPPPVDGAAKGSLPP